MAVFLRSVSICVVALLGLAVVHKVRVLRNGQAPNEPLLRLTSWRRRHAFGVLLAVGILEAGIAAMLLLAPAVGFAMLAALASGYAVELRRLARDEPCNCFGSTLRVGSRQTAMVRNILLAAFGVTAAVLYTASAIKIAPISETTFGVALVVSSVIVSADLLQRLPHTTAEPPTNGKRAG
jgi:hypothetical protein